MKIMKKRIWSTLLAVVLVVGLLAGCGSSSSTESSSAGDSAASGSSDTTTEKTTLRLGVMTGISEHFIGLVGIEQGIYDKYGIDLQITEFGTGVDAVGAITTGQIDIAEIMDFGIINRLGQTSENSTLRILAQNYVTKATDSDAGMSFFVNPDKIKSIDDIKGKNISVSLGTVNEYQNAKLLEYAGLSDSDITTVPVESLSDVVAIAKKGGEIDGAWASGQHAINLKKAGWTALITGDELGLTTRDMSVGSDTIAANTDLLEKYFKARSEAVDYITNNLDDIASFIKEKTGIEEDTFKANINSNELENSLTKETYDALTDLKDWAVAQGSFEDFDLDKFVVTDGLKQAFPDRVTYK